MKKDAGAKLKAFYSAMFKAFGPQGWWPGETPFEVIIGAILTQNTSWSNVEKAIANLKKEKLLTPKRLHALKAGELAAHIRPAGYFNVKAKRLKNFLDYLFEKNGGNLSRFLKKDAAALREELLPINGIGPETADSIVLYAAGHPEVKVSFAAVGASDVDVTVEQLQGGTSYVFPLDLDFVDAAGAKERVAIDVDGKKVTKRVHVTRAPSSMVADPEEYLVGTLACDAQNACKTGYRCSASRCVP